jgi:cell wall-associated NlpC family hydrolase
VKDGDKIVFDSETGELLTGMQTIDGQNYWLDANGSPIVNANGEDGYYTDENGVITTTQAEIEAEALRAQQEAEAQANYELQLQQIAEYNAQQEANYQAQLQQIAQLEQQQQTEAVQTTEPANVEQPAVQTTTEQTAAYDPYTQPVETVTPSTQVAASPTATTSTVSAPTNSNISSTIASAAMSQLGNAQDCTMLVTNSLAAAGINFHGWPSEYTSLGTVTNNPVPGDIIVYSGHVAVYIGNGQAVHGGWNGGTTAVSSVNCSQALQCYVHVG